MAYKYDGICTTQSGKVIYERKKHEFTPCDLKRIAQGMRPSRNFKEVMCVFQAASAIVATMAPIYVLGIGEDAEKLLEDLNKVEEVITEHPEIIEEELGKPPPPWLDPRDPRPWWQKLLQPLNPYL